MSQINNTSFHNNPARKKPSSKGKAEGQKGRRTAFIIGSVVIVLLLTIIGISLYITTVAPFRRTIIRVDDTTINMDYFLMRTRFADADPMEMIKLLTNEQLVKMGAPRYVAEVTPEDVDQKLRDVARGESETISESEFKEWYRQLLNQMDLSDSEYREIATTSLLASRLHEYLAERMSTVAEQIHVYNILLKTEEDAEEIRVRWEAGENFTDLAREVSLDEQSKENGGDLGWLPRGFLAGGFDEVAFNLSIGDVSEPLIYLSEPTSSEAEIFYYLLMVSEKAEAREIDEGPLQILEAKLLDDWLLEEKDFYEVEWNYNSEIHAWLHWQLLKE